MILQVAFYPHGSHILHYETCADLAEAVALVRYLAMPGNNRGLWPQMLYNDGSIIFRASYCRDRIRPGKAPWWSMSFPTETMYKSRACIIGEGAGVRYASHRVGYRASERAFAKFIAAIDHYASRDAERVAA